MKISLLCLGLLCSFNGHTQIAAPRGWHLNDFKTSGNYGISLNEAYQFLLANNLKSTPVVVAILDDGIDTAHEDLQKILWVNSKEMPGNKIDDDGNGYADDLHGWNFLGNKDGRNVGANSSEWIRVYWRYKEKYEGKNIDTSQLLKPQKYEYALWQKARSGVVGKGMNEEDLTKLRAYLANLFFCDSLLKGNFKNNEFTAAQLAAFKPAGKMERDLKEFFLKVFKQFTVPDVTNQFVLDEFQQYVVGEVRKAGGEKYPPEDHRRDITGDDEKGEINRWYGNADISNGALMHGSHLAGIVAAERNNGKGVQGIADHVKVMMVRTSAEGDEYDKDIATGIRYAVDNGARVINMSFGKSLSPDKKMIDDAVSYALAHDVLLVQAAGNSKRNINALDNFPNPHYLLSDSVAPNWITVGASDKSGMAAEFSNYGNKTVNVFAPGVGIYSTIPGSKYMSWDGTSMAAPVVAGVAALLRSYFPKLTALDIKNIIEKSVTVTGIETIIPGTKEKGFMDKLCSSGGIVNAFKAVQLAVRYNPR